MKKYAVLLLIAAMVLPLVVSCGSSEASAANTVLDKALDSYKALDKQIDEAKKPADLDKIQQELAVVQSNVNSLVPKMAKLNKGEKEAVGKKFMKVTKEQNGLLTKLATKRLQLSGADSKKAVDDKKKADAKQ